MTIKANLPVGLKEQVQERSRRRRKSLVGEVRTEALTSQTRNDPAPTLRMEVWPLSKLKGARRQIRTSAPAQFERVMRSVNAHGFSKPIIIDREGRIVDGHILVEVARKLGLDSIHCVVLDHLSEDELRLLRISLNRIAETGSWDLSELSLELEELGTLDFDLTLSGFEAPELDLILHGAAEAKGEKGIPSPSPFPVSRLGDLWLLGGHRLLCGDCLDPASYERLLEGRQLQGVFSDPPYNIKIDGVVSGLGKVKHGDFAMGCGEMSDDQFRVFLAGYLKLCKAYAAPGAVLYACMDWRQIDLLLLAGRDAGLSRINKAIWNKGSGGMGGLYRSAYEEIAVFCNGTSPATNNVELGRNGRDRSNVWNYPGANRKGSSAGASLKDHPTPKPVELVADALLDVTQRGDLILDPFMGSGTTIVAAHSIERLAVGIELDPAYVDVAIRRWEQETGQQARHAELDLSFAEVGTQRKGAESVAIAN
ncbi:MAG: DNA modification methylase [Rhizorhabdus sp.]|uniref:DNA modification methylase n=1 Tax=Rhizorhabdus sp. TaxID=1968843 RepID=UPI001B55EE9E|nr:DNA modification methylase [Rhizorhabdus sp.]MBP8233871.1 DNA modification methylase [Rhizorhabdus sp.]